MVEIVQDFPIFGKTTVREFQIKLQLNLYTEVPDVVGVEF